MRASHQKLLASRPYQFRTSRGAAGAAGATTFQAENHLTRYIPTGNVLKNVYEIQLIRKRKKGNSDYLSLCLLFKKKNHQGSPEITQSSPSKTENSRHRSVPPFHNLFHHRVGKWHLPYGSCKGPFNKRIHICIYIYCIYTLKRLQNMLDDVCSNCFHVARIKRPTHLATKRDWTTRCLQRLNSQGPKPF